ncbi:hypothetical protein K443DRAFT_492120 [Laccaria amethystina LaAM-08-1]|uniref:Uncharacterized protein n=1 Tax=Laccaria amethystina LaAM-08-1 TaxID=1095629 RepID=A0A0C9X161_9AGAR|nr:hypothetical protein K443DRAFT_492120 [Laccaria amethystina LaAM-08-1]
MARTCNGQMPEWADEPPWHHHCTVSDDLLVTSHVKFCKKLAFHSIIHMFRPGPP